MCARRLSARNYYLTCCRIYCCTCSTIIYYRYIYLVFGSRVAIYGIVSQYIYSTSCLRNSFVSIWVEYDVRWYYYLQCICFTVVCLTLFTYPVSNNMCARRLSARNYYLACCRIHCCMCSTVIYYRHIYLVFSSRVTIYSSIIKYICRTSCLRYYRIRSRIYYNIIRNYYLECICLAISNASFFTYLVSNGMCTWGETTWYIDLTCSGIYGCPCSAVIFYRNIYIILVSRISTYSNIVQYIYSSTCLRYTLSSWINYYWIGTYCYSSCRLLARLSSSWSFITYRILYSIRS